MVTDVPPLTSLEQSSQTDNSNATEPECFGEVEGEVASGGVSKL